MTEAPIPQDDHRTAAPTSSDVASPGSEPEPTNTSRDGMKQPLRPISRFIPPLRRLLDHRDQLTDDIAGLRRTIWRFSQDQQRLLYERMHTEPDVVPREVAATPGAAGRTWMKHHPYTEPDAPLFPTSVPVPSADDDALVPRIIDAYHCSADRDHYGDALWRRIAERHEPIHEALMRRDHEAVTQILREPDTNHLFFGYEYFFRDSPIQADYAARDSAERAKDVLVRLAEALALLPVENPEGAPLWGANVQLDADAVAERVERRLGIPVAIHPVQGGFTGLAIGDRLVNDRMLHGVYYAHRVRQLVRGCAAPAILEVGAGLGYAAYYAHQLGLPDYTIVDLPMTNVAQAYFLGRMLGPDRVLLEGEPERGDTSQQVKIRTPSLLAEPRSFDLVLNADSLPELGAKLAFEYVERIFEMSDLLLSVNHEANEYGVVELFVARDDVDIERFPFWLRNGYVEEVVRARTSP